MAAAAASSSATGSLDGRTSPSAITTVEGSGSHHTSDVLQWRKRWPLRRRSEARAAAARTEAEASNDSVHPATATAPAEETPTRVPTATAPPRLLSTALRALCPRKPPLTAASCRAYVAANANATAADERAATARDIVAIATISAEAVAAVTTAATLRWRGVAPLVRSTSSANSHNRAAQSARGESSAQIMPAVSKAHASLLAGLCSGGGHSAARRATPARWVAAKAPQKASSGSGASGRWCAAVSAAAVRTDSMRRSVSAAPAAAEAKLQPKATPASMTWAVTTAAPPSKATSRGDSSWAIFTARANERCRPPPRPAAGPDPESEPALSSPSIA